MIRSSVRRNCSSNILESDQPNSILDSNLLEPSSRSKELYKSIQNIETRLGYQPDTMNPSGLPPPGYGFPPPGMPPMQFPPPVPYGAPLPPMPPHLMPPLGVAQTNPPTGVTITIPDDKPRRNSRSRSRERRRSRSPMYHGRRGRRGRSRSRTRSPSPYRSEYHRTDYAPASPRYSRAMSPGEESDIIKLREQVFELENVIRLKDEQLNMKEERNLFYSLRNIFLHNDSILF